MTAYRKVVVQSYVANGEPSSKKVRAKPLPGQELDEMHVECSSAMRRDHPPGSLFLITARVTCREDGTPFLYTSFRWKYEVLTPAVAKKFIQDGGWR